MIDFACKKFDLDEVMRCGLGLTKAEFKIFKIFLKTNKCFTTNQVSNDLKLEISTVQRAVKKLYTLDILSRSQKNLHDGGYVFEYKLKDKSAIRNKVLKMISSWTERVEQEFNNW